MCNYGGLIGMWIGLSILNILHIMPNILNKLIKIYLPKFVAKFNPTKNIINVNNLNIHVRTNETLDYYHAQY